MSDSDILKVGDNVIVTKDLSELNKYMEKYSGLLATVTSVKEGHSYGQIAKLDIDDGEWSWYYSDKLDQIFKI